MRTIIAETPTFTRQADVIFCEEEKRDLLEVLGENPMVGEEVSGMYGIRKLCFAAAGEGRRGHGRAIYYYRDHGVPIYVLLACTQSADTGMMPAECRAVSEFTAALRSTECERT